MDCLHASHSVTCSPMPIPGWGFNGMRVRGQETELAGSREKSPKVCWVAQRRD